MIPSVAGRLNERNTLRSTRNSERIYRYGMKKHGNWETWHKRAKEAKTASGARPDVEIAELVSEILEASGRSPVKRAVVNHWLNGRRDPSLAEFFALCHVIDANPGDVLFGQDVAENVIPHPAAVSLDENMAEVRSLLEKTDATGRRMAVAILRSALSEYQGSARKKGAA